MDKELQVGLAASHKAALELSNHQTGKTTRIRNGDFAPVFTDRLRAEGPGPHWGAQEARILNEQTGQFVPMHEWFKRQCRDRLAR